MICAAVQFRPPSKLRFRTRSISPDFADAMRIFLPSWFQNSRAKTIKINRVEGTSWRENLLRRSQWLRRQVLAASQLGDKLLFLDADVFVISDVGEGFSSRHPISVARWPGLNAGVMFFNTAVPFDWRGLLDEMLALVTRCCTEPTASAPETRRRFPNCDQSVWQKLLRNVQDQVCKLDMKVWNFCYDPPYWDRMLKRHRDVIRIAHVKGHGKWSAQKIESLKKAFPEVL